MADAPPTNEPQELELPSPDALSESIFQGFAQMLSREQVAELYTMCLDDVDRRIRLLQEAATPPDEDTFRGIMHAIKGSCGMVGAVQLAAQAAALEQTQPPATNDFPPYEEFLCASARLRRILAAKSIPL